MNAENKTPLLVIAIVVVGLVLVGAPAGVYFLVLKQPAELSGPEATVVKFFEAIEGGDTNVLSALFTPGTGPGEAELKLISLMFGANGIEMDDVQTELMSETATDARVVVKDVTMTIAGRSVRMSDLGTEQNFDFKLKNINGEWLIESGGRLPFVPSTDQMQQPVNPGSTGT